MDSSTTLLSVIAVGCGATAVMDLWLLLVRRLGVPTLDFALLGRWFGHAVQGRLAHTSIARAPAIAGERALGWLAHYLTGVAFAGLLVLLMGAGWLTTPRPGPALGFGLFTVLAPWLILQPAMGAGFFASRTPTPFANAVRNLANHAVFGAGLYLAASGLAGWLA